MPLPSDDELTEAPVSSAALKEENDASGVRRTSSLLTRAEVRSTPAASLAQFTTHLPASTAKSFPS